MRIGLLGTGIVGTTLASKLVSLGHEVKMGSRSANNEKALEWVSNNKSLASCGTFQDAAQHGEIVINATSGQASLAALELAGADNLDGKTLIDVSNPLSFDTGGPTLSVGNTDSIGEQIQRTFPNANVIKTLNTMNCGLMVDPGKIPGTHNVFVNGNDENAKQQAKDLLHAFGWPSDSIIDLGDITASRGVEGVILLWIKVMNTRGNFDFNWHIASA